MVSSGTRVGIVGAGGVVTAFHLPVLRATPEITIRWICDQDLQRAETVAAGFGIRRAYASVDQCTDGRSARSAA